MRPLDLRILALFLLWFVLPLSGVGVMITLSLDSMVRVAQMDVGIDRELKRNVENLRLLAESSQHKTEKETYMILLTGAERVRVNRAEFLESFANMKHSILTSLFLWLGVCVFIALTGSIRLIQSLKKLFLQAPNA